MEKKKERKKERGRIKPGSIKIASDKDLPPIPNQMIHNNETIEKEDIPQSFANYFQDKINKLAQTCNTDQNVFNGEKVLNSNNENFMTETIYNPLLPIMPG